MNFGVIRTRYWSRGGEVVPHYENGPRLRRREGDDETDNITRSGAGYVEKDF